jgi:hypothetical protein
VPKRAQARRLPGSFHGSGASSTYSNTSTIPMTEFDTTVRKVGDSMGILIPAGIVKELNARPGTKIHVVIPRKVDWSSIRGKFQSGIPTDELIRASRAERD